MPPRRPVQEGGDRHRHCEYGSTCRVWSEPRGRGGSARPHLSAVAEGTPVRDRILSLRRPSRPQGSGPLRPTPRALGRSALGVRDSAGVSGPLVVPRATTRPPVARPRGRRPSCRPTTQRIPPRRTRDDGPVGSRAGRGRRERWVGGDRGRALPETTKSSSETLRATSTLDVTGSRPRAVTGGVGTGVRVVAPVYQV